MSKLNVQGLARRDKGIKGLGGQCTYLIPDEGNVFVSMDLCFPVNETEFLTKKGWKFFDSISEEEEIFQVNPNTLKGSWAIPKRRVDQTITQKWAHYHNSSVDLLVTAEHKMLFIGQINHPTRADKRLYRKIIKANEPEKLTLGCHVPTFCFSDLPKEETVSDTEIWVACMLHADGHYHVDHGVYSIQVSRPRKREKVKELVGFEGNVYAVREGQTLEVEHFNYIKIQNPLLEGKEFKNLELLTERQLDVFVEALSFWDGSFATKNSKTGQFVWGSTKKQEVEKVQTFLSTRGFSTYQKASLKKEINQNTYYSLSIRKQGCVRFSTKRTQPAPSGSTAVSKVDFFDSDQRAVCFEVEEGFLFVRQKGRTYISGNCSGEPTVTAHYSGDIRYRYATLDGVGKPPFWDSDDILMIDDIYLMFMSATKEGKILLKGLWDKTFPEGDFVTQWLKDSKAIKKPIDGDRQYYKMVALALLYGLGPKKLQKQSYEAFNREISFQEAQEIYRAYWHTFSGVKKLADKLQAKGKRGWFPNAFGYRLVFDTSSEFDSTHKACNYLIQSSVSGQRSCRGQT